MQILNTSLDGVKRIRPKRYGDERGWFAEIFHEDRFREAGLPGRFLQDNQSLSRKGVLRGLHYQLGKPQGKLVRVLSGHIWDVALDLRRESPDFGRWEAFHLEPCTDEGDPDLLWIPEGFAHGFLVLSETAEVLYKVTEGYYPEGERCILWSDPTLAIPWPLLDLGSEGPFVSPRDAAGVPFSEADLPPLAVSSLLEPRPALATPPTH